MKIILSDDLICTAAHKTSASNIEKLKMGLGRALQRKTDSSNKCSHLSFELFLSVSPPSLLDTEILQECLTLALE